MLLFEDPVEFTQTHFLTVDDHLFVRKIDSHAVQ